MTGGKVVIHALLLLVLVQHTKPFSSVRPTRVKGFWSRLDQRIVFSYIKESSSSAFPRAGTDKIQARVGRSEANQLYAGRGGIKEERAPRRNASCMDGGLDFGFG
jgi:hypothetical protein